MSAIVCFVLILTVSVAGEGDVFMYNSFADYQRNWTRPVHIRKPSFSFDYHCDDMLNVNINFMNVPPNVATDLYFKYTSGEADKMKVERVPRTNGVNYFEIRRLLKYKMFTIGVELMTGSTLCTRKTIVKGKRVSVITEKKNDTPSPDICFTSSPCLIEVDLSKHICGDPYTADGTTDITIQTSHQTSLPSEIIETTTYKISEKSPEQRQHLNILLIYVIPSVIVTCVTILLIYRNVKKYCHRNSRPMESMELNTYATANEVVYADLSLAHKNYKPPRRDEESPYAQIIGVMKPVPP